MRRWVLKGAHRVGYALLHRCRLLRRLIMHECRFRGCRRVQCAWAWFKAGSLGSRPGLLTWSVLPAADAAHGTCSVAGAGAGEHEAERSPCRPWPNPTRQAPWPGCKAELLAGLTGKGMHASIS